MEETNNEHPLPTVSKKNKQNKQIPKLSSGGRRPSHGGGTVAPKRHRPHKRKQRRRTGRRG